MTLSHRAQTARPVPMLAGGALLGNLRDMAAAPHTFPAQALAAHGGIVGMRAGPRRIVALGRPDYARHVLVTQHERYPRGRINRNLGTVIGDGLLATEGDLWLARRRRIQPAFRPERLQALVRSVNRVMDPILDGWTDTAHAGGGIDAMREAKRIAMRVIGRALLSLEIDTGSAGAFAAAVDASLIQLVRRNWSLVQLPLWVPVPVNRALNRTRRTLDAFVGAEVSRRLDDPAYRPDDMLTALLADRGGAEPWTRAALVNEAKTLFVAGFETTATALTWTLHLLAAHPAVADALQAEIDAVLGGRDPEMADLPRLPYGAAVVEEAMRLYPPVYNIGRECAEDDEIDGWAVPKGATMLISIFAIQRSPEWWDAPEAFRPERFLSADTAQRRAALPYAVGKHQCIGSHFANIELLMIVARIVQRFRLSHRDRTPVGMAARTTLVPDRPVELLMEVRS